MTISSNFNRPGMEMFKLLVNFIPFNIHLNEYLKTQHYETKKTSGY